MTSLLRCMLIFFLMIYNWDRNTCPNIFHDDREKWRYVAITDKENEWKVVVVVTFDSDIFSIIVKYLDIVPRETATK